VIALPIQAPVGAGNTGKLETCRHNGLLHPSANRSSRPGSPIGRPSACKARPRRTPTLLASAKAGRGWGESVPRNSR
jgi:hypothetical protein